MKTILQINSSIYSAEGQSSRLADKLVAHLRRQDPQARLVVRDLAVDPVPHLDVERFGAFVTAPEERDAKQRALVAYSDALIAELEQADVVVIGLPMYNFGVPSQLKAWIDHVARAGRTFRYTEKGPIGLLEGKRAYVLAARGGQYVGTPLDTQTQYVRDVLAFMGISDVEFVYAEGLAMGDAARAEALTSAHASIRELAPSASLAA